MSALGVGAAEQLADARARRPRAGDALGAGLAPGDRPRAVRRAADEARAHGRARPPRSRGWWTRRCARRSSRRPGRRSSTSRSTTSSWRPRHAPSRPRCRDPPSLAGRRRRRVERAAELLRGAERPVVMAGTGPLLGATARTRCARCADELGVPVFLERPRARLRAGRPPACSSRARAATALKERGRRARDRRADGLPARLRRLVRRGHRDRRDRLVAARARRTRARSPPSCTAASPRRSTRCARARPAGPTARAGSRRCARSRTRSAPPSRRS